MRYRPDTIGNMNAYLASNCQAARTAGMTIYGIAYQAGPAGENAIKSCASLPLSSHYFQTLDVDDIQDVFAQIASEIKDLRLTQ